MTVLDQVSDEKILAYRDSVTKVVLNKAIQLFKGNQRMIGEFYVDVMLDAESEKILNPVFLRNMRQIDAFLPSSVATAQDVLLMGMSVGSATVKKMLETRPELTFAMELQAGDHDKKAFPYVRLAARAMACMPMAEVNDFIVNFRKAHEKMVETESVRMGDDIVKNMRQVIESERPENPFKSGTFDEGMELFAELLQNENFYSQVKENLLAEMRSQMTELVAEMEKRESELGILPQVEYPDMPRFG